MKSTNKKTAAKKAVKKKAANKKAVAQKAVNKKKNRGRDHLLNRLFFGVLGVIVLLLVILAVIVFKKKTGLDLAAPYDEDAVIQVSDGDRLQMAEGFASDLCVAGDTVALNDISFSNSEKAGLFDLDNSQVLFAQNLHQKAYPASITKVMTAILAAKYADMSQEVTVSARAVDLGEDSQVCGLREGDVLTMDELFRGMMIFSGNDAAIAIAETVGGSVENFVEMMNQEAQALGATNTHFANPHGLQDEEHYTTVYDIYLMLREAMNYDVFMDVAKEGYCTLHVTHKDGKSESLYLSSTDQYMVGQKEAPKGVTVIGGKTGTTDEAGSCLALISQNSYGQPFISIVLGAQGKTSLYDHMNQLLSQINF